MDKAVDRLHRKVPFQFERQRVEHLFELYKKAAAPLKAASTAKIKVEGSMIGDVGARRIENVVCLPRRSGGSRSFARDERPNARVLSGESLNVRARDLGYDRADHLPNPDAGH